MLAELHYTAVDRSIIMADIEKVLTGAANLAALSTSVTLASSSMVGAPGTWEVQTSSAVVTDMTTAATTNITAKAFRQTCTTNPAKYKYLKIAVGNSSTVATTLNVISALSNGLTSGNLLNISTHFKNFVYTPLLNTASGTNVNSLVVQIAIVPGITAIAMGTTGLTLTTVLLVVDISEAWLPSAATTNYLPAVCGIPATVNNNQFKFHMFSPMFTYNTVVYGAANTNPSTNALMSFGKTVPSHVPALFSLEQYKFADFKATGTYYDMLPVSLHSVNYTYGNGSTNYINITQVGQASPIPYLWGCNNNAFGPNGNTFNTSEGICCRFNNYMIKVM